MRSVVAIDVAAPADLVFGLVCDVERWADLLPHYVSVRRLPRREGHGLPRAGAVPPDAVLAQYVAVRPIVRPLGLGVPIVWRSFSWVEPDRRRLRFRHVGGASGGMDVVWSIERAPNGCRIEIAHSLSRPIPLPLLGRFGRDAWPALIDRLVVRSIAGETLRAVRSISEAVARARPAVLDESGAAPSSYPHP